MRRLSRREAPWHWAPCAQAPQLIFQSRVLSREAIVLLLEALLEVLHVVLEVLVLVLEALLLFRARVARRDVTQPQPRRASTLSSWCPRLRGVHRM